MHMFDGYGMGGGGMFMMILFWVVTIIAIYFILKTFTEKNGRGGSPESAEEILKKRYARGEISPEEFKKIKEELK